MDTEINVKVNYAGLIKRIAARILDFIMFYSPLLILFIFVLLSEDDSFSLTYGQLDDIAEDMMLMIVITLVPTVFEILMIAKLGGTPGKLLCNIRIKSTNTFKNATLIQAAIRSIFKVIFQDILPFLISIFCLFLLDSSSGVLDYIVDTMAKILIFICAIFNQRKQTFYDKIAKTVVIDYKPS